MTDNAKRLVFAVIGSIILVVGLVFLFSTNVPVSVLTMTLVTGGLTGFIIIINLPAQQHKIIKVVTIVATALVLMIGGSWLLSIINPAWSLEPFFYRFFPISFPSTDISLVTTIAMLLFMIMGIVIIGWVYTSRPVVSPTILEDPPTKVQLKPTTPSKVQPKPTASPGYLICSVCGNEEFIEYENYQEMIPLNSGQKLVILTGIYSFVCANCKAVLESGRFPSTQPVAGIKYISCANCGSTEYLQTIVTRVRVTDTPDPKVEDLNKSVSTTVCFKCGQPFVDPDKESQKTKKYLEFSAASD
ncbi:MAG: hypothetical protein QW658_01200 [Candidatus Bathyarchaeia archaeon]